MDKVTQVVSSDAGSGADAGPEAMRPEKHGHRSLERLRDRIELAAREITQLRKQNAELAERIARMETDQHDYAALLASEEDPEVLRGKINRFIEAIDEFLKEGDKPA